MLHRLLTWVAVVDSVHTSRWKSSTVHFVLRKLPCEIVYEHDTIYRSPPKPYLRHALGVFNVVQRVLPIHTPSMHPTYGNLFDHFLAHA